MPTITDCERWLDNVKLTSPDDVYSLCKTVLDEEGCGDFQCSNRGKELYIRASDSEQWLQLASRIARKNFLDMLKIRYCGGEDLMTWYTTKGGTMSNTG